MLNKRHFTFPVFCIIALFSASSFMFMGGIVDLNNLENYSNQDIPVFVTEDTTPSNNSLTDEVATLGRVLFYDKQLSLNATVSCGSCHQQQFAFGDTAVVSKGFDGKLTERHSMRLINLSYKSLDSVFWDRRGADLEEQPAITIANPIEMGFSGIDGQPDLDSLTRRLEQIDYYQNLFEFAFGDTQITIERINLSIAQFVRSIVSFDSKFDHGVNEIIEANNNEFDFRSFTDSFPNFTEQENFGKSLFISPFPQLVSPFDTNPAPRDFFGCANCHSAPSFGQTPVFRGNNGVIGVAGDSTKIDLSVIRSPSLRNMFTTGGKEIGPFMHDGSLKSLRDVLKHYAFIPFNPNNISMSIGVGGFLQQDARRPMTEEQEDALIAFMKTLTGNDVFINPKWSNPFDNNDKLVVIPVCNGNVVTTNIEVSICDGESVDGYNKEGEYTDTFYAQNGCDSIRKLRVFLNPIYNDTINIIICEGENYNGHSEPGTYEDIFQSIAGCDSIIIVELDVLDITDPDCSMVAIGDVSNRNQFEVYPNPFSNEIVISSLYNGLIQLQVHNTLGELIISDRYLISGGKLNINTYDLGSGIYVLTLLDLETRLLSSFKLIKKIEDILIVSFTIKSSESS